MKLVSAILPTRGRPKWAKQAVECFLAQTYLPKNLFIIDDADDPSFPNGTPHFNVAHLLLKDRKSIPEKRNIATDIANGEIIMHFDSDDWSHPQRMADQVKRLEESGKQVTGYHSLLFHVEPHGPWLKYIGDAADALGTSLAYTKSFWQAHPFRQCPGSLPNVGEDIEFVRDARNAGELLSVDAGLLMWARIHSDNTSVKNIDGAQTSYRHVPESEVLQGLLR